MSAQIKRGFTLIELLVVISIIGILSVLVAADLNAARARARDAERKSDLTNIQTALRLYYNDHGTYPTSSGGNIYGCGSSGTNFCIWTQAWSNGSTVYMPTLPVDPISAQHYFYQQTGTDNYNLYACLENTSDSSCTTPISDFTCNSGCAFELSQ